MRLIFFGSPEFAAIILEDLIAKGADIVAVVTKPDRPQKRSQEPIAPPVKLVAQKANIPVLQPLKASTEDFAAVLKGYYPDLFVVVAFGEIFKNMLLELPAQGCINVHASLLPKYRGAAPIHRAIMAGERESGVTIMSMAAELDAGEILAMAKTPIGENMTTGELFQKLSEISKEVLWNVLQDFEKGHVVRVKQDPSLVTYAPKVTPEEAEIDWSQAAETVHNHIRGLTPKPGAWCFVEIRGEIKRLLVKKSVVEKGISGNAAHILEQKGLVIGCGRGALRLLEVQLEGKKALSVDDFLKGILKDQMTFKLK